MSARSFRYSWEWGQFRMDARAGLEVKDDARGSCHWGSLIAVAVAVAVAGRSW